MNANCPICDADVSVDSGAEAGELILCSDCGAELEIKSVTGGRVVLEEAPEEEEDWGE